MLVNSKASSWNLNLVALNKNLQRSILSSVQSQKGIKSVFMS